MKAAILCVGTELTIGQVTNSNASTIAKKLKQLGVLTMAHLTVPDDRPLILEALKFIATRADLLFVTGGLGPTSDDFTRDLIAEWSGRPLEFDQGSWDHVHRRLSDRGIEIRETQRQQCYFPKGSQVLPNPEGTANAFYLSVFQKDVFVLPGPPREIEAIWRGSIAARLTEKAKGLDKALTFAWDTLGLGESDVSHMTESCLQGVEIEKGYRVHLPYVEVKVSFFESQKKDLMPWVKKLDAVLAPITITRNEEDIAELLARALQEAPAVRVVDTLSGSVLLNRLGAPWRKFLPERKWSFANSEDGDGTGGPEVILSLRPVGATSATAEIHYQGARFRDEFEAPALIAKMPERRALYFSERALVFWWQQALRMI